MVPTELTRIRALAEKAAVHLLDSRAPDEYYAAQSRFKRALDPATVIALCDLAEKANPEPAQAQVSDAEVEAALLSDETAVDRWRGQGIPAPEILMREALEAAARARLSAPLPDGRS